MDEPLIGLCPASAFCQYSKQNIGLRLALESQSSSALQGDAIIALSCLERERFVTVGRRLGPLNGCAAKKCAGVFRLIRSVRFLRSKVDVRVYKYNTAYGADVAGPGGAALWPGQG
jgi:hypothetical protein